MLELLMRQSNILAGRFCAMLTFIQQAVQRLLGYPCAIFVFNLVFTCIVRKKKGKQTFLKLVCDHKAEGEEVRKGVLCSAHPTSACLVGVLFDQSPIIGANPTGRAVTGARERIRITREFVKWSVY